jgi:non-heme chloroperoxidase
MPSIPVGQENSGPINLYYEDHGSGRPVVLIHGYPLSGRAWDRQVPVLLENGHRFLDTFYNIDKTRGTLVSEQAYQASWNVAASASATAAVACIPTWETDFRPDLPNIDIPMLVIQGDDDQVLPYPKTGERLPRLITDLQMVVIDGGPHAVPWTHADQVNAALLKFIG